MIFQCNVHAISSPLHLSDLKLIFCYEATIKHPHYEKSTSRLLSSMTDYLFTFSKGRKGLTTALRDHPFLFFGHITHHGLFSNIMITFPPPCFYYKESFFSIMVRVIIIICDLTDITFISSLIKKVATVIKNIAFPKRVNNTHKMF